MFGKHARLNALAARKQLLIAESELNRAQFGGDIAELAAGCHALNDRAKVLGSLASSAGVLVAALATLRRGKTAGSDQKMSWLKTILNAASLVSNLWPGFRAAARDKAVE